MKKFLIKSLIILGSICYLPLGNTFAQISNPGFTIMPEIEKEDQETLSGIIKEIWATGGQVMETYKEQAEKLTLEQQMATGVMNRDTILEYVVYLVRFISQIGLFIGAGMIIYAWYKYATDVFRGGTGKASEIIKRAVIGVLVISFAYAIMKFFTAAFLWT